MRKSLFLTLVLSLCVADFGAFAATVRGNARGNTATANNATQQNAAPVSARAGARQKVVSAPSTSSSASVQVSARAAARQKVASPVATTTEKTSSGSVAARAATKKALSMGTKVSAATENTAVSQECQNAYYGCMDAFCMLDNAAGGRCQCSDRSAELDVVMDEIMQLDEQSLRIASEGVEQIQMGEYASQINARAKSVESGISSSKNSTKTSAGTGSKNSSTVRTLDLSMFSSNSFFDSEEEDDGIFGEQQDLSSISALNEIEGKTGDALQKGAAKICTAQIPAECKASLAVLQTAYVSKVKSDCIGYENALKQQKSASQQKLLAAQKAVRDAALDEVRRQNKYETVGECAIAFAQCMQTTAECGSDYTGCVTLAAAENVKSNKKGSKAKQTTIKGVVSGADITLAATTMEQLLAKKEICASVTKQCVNANKNDAVWDVFLRNAAPALKSAELIAEQNLRSNCIPTVAECFKNACKSQFGDDDESYDMCLSNPETYKSLCKVQLEPCLEATGGSYDKAEQSSLWNGLVAMLNSMKVDVCTKEVKDCLLSEDRCGEDFSKCIGMDTQSIGKMCPIDKLTACVTDGRYAQRGADGTVVNEDEIRNYVAQVAQGLALNIENSFAKVCQSAAETALIKVCGSSSSEEDGDSATCSNLDINLSALTDKMHVAYQDKNNKTKYYESIDEYASYLRSNNKDMKGLLNLRPVVVGQTDIYGIQYKESTEENGKSIVKFEHTSTNGATESNGYTGNVDDVKTQIESKYNLLLSQIESDPTVTYCISGRQIEGFDGNKFGKQTDEQTGRFSHLLDAAKQQLASQVLNTVFSKYNDKYNEVSEKLSDEYENLAKRTAEYINEAELDIANERACKVNEGVAWGRIVNFWDKGGCQWRHVYVANYDKATNKCTVSRTTYYCQSCSGDLNVNISAIETVMRKCAVDNHHDPLIIQYPSSNAQ